MKIRGRYSATGTALLAAAVHGLISGAVTGSAVTVVLVAIGVALGAVTGSAVTVVLVAIGVLLGAITGPALTVVLVAIGVILGAAVAYAIAADEIRGAPEPRDVPLDERMYAALADAGFDETDGWNAVHAVMPLLEQEGQR